MSHQSQLEKSKYRNWVKGGLAYKYLRDGIGGFADDVVQMEHTRILGVVNNTSGKACDQCKLNTLKPIHKYEVDPTTGQNTCPWGQSNCNCLYPKKKKSCPNKVCDVILEEILKSHGSTPPTPYWKNTDVNKWYSSPWEIAKCFIHAPGYSDKTSSADIDINGLLHLFISNINLHSHFSCKMTGTNIFMKCREGRNKIFHSPAMEMEDDDLTECLDDIIAILEDPKELATIANAYKSVSRLKQLMQADFVITTYNEMEICRTALDAITKKSDELKEDIHNAKIDIDLKHAETIIAIDDKTKNALNAALEERDKPNESLNQRVDQLELTVTDIKQRLSCLERRVDKLDAIRQNYQKQFDFVKEKQVFQKKLVSFYERNNVYTSTSPLKLKENGVNISEVYVASEMIMTNSEENTNDGRIQTSRKIGNYRELLHTSCRRNQSIYIVGDVGSGKSTFCKMMIQNWCSAVASDEDKSEVPQVLVQQKHCRLLASKDLDVKELRQFDFLFFLSLKRMGGLINITEMIKAVVIAADLTTADFIDRIFNQDSERCLIVADGLDEWTPPDRPSVLQNVSYGLPERGIAKCATLFTFSRPSARGILNLESSECDLRVELVGINKFHVPEFIEKYMSVLKNTDKSLGEFRNHIRSLNLDHLEKSPLLLQQLVWLFFNGFEIGKSRSDVYCNIVNIMLRWSENKSEFVEQDCVHTEATMQMQLPTPLRKFTSCKANEMYILMLAKVAFESLTAEIYSSSFSRSRLKENCFSNTAITTLIKLGILVEENNYNTTQESTQLSFTHMSYLEFFAAVYASSKLNVQPSDKKSCVLKELYQTYKTAADILQSSNLFKMICGLCPSAISEVSHFISDIVKRDESITRNVTTVTYTFDPVLSQIQELIFSCLSECGTDNKPMFYLSDVAIHRSSEMSVLRSLNADNVVSCHISKVGYYIYKPRCSDEEWRLIAQLKQLQYLHISVCHLPHDQMTMLLNFIQEAPLRCITLIHVTCQDCHSFDLSKNECLQNLTIFKCFGITISDINTEHLEKIQLDDNRTLRTCLLHNVRSLTELYLGSYSIPSLRCLPSKPYVDTLTVTPEMRNLKRIKLKSVIMSLETMRTFVDSLPTLQQSVQTYAHNDSKDSRYSSLKDMYEYVRLKGNLFEITEYSPEYSPKSLTFRTRKQ